MKTTSLTSILALLLITLSACQNTAQAVPPKAVAVDQYNAAGTALMQRQAVAPAPQGVLMLDSGTAPVFISTSSNFTISAGQLHVRLSGSAVTSGTAAVSGSSVVSGSARISGSSVLSGTAAYSTVSGSAAKIPIATTNAIGGVYVSEVSSGPTLTIANDGAISLSGVTPSWIKANLPPATASALGAIKVGANLSITPDGTLSAAASGGGGDTLWSANGANIYRDTGNVGVGVNNPTRKLQVAGNVWFGSTGVMGNIPDAPLNLFASQASTMLTQLRLLNTGGSAGSAIDFHTTSGGNANPGLRLGAWDDGNYSAALQVLVKQSGLSGQGAMQQVAIFSSNGNVGIGSLWDGRSTKPAYKLDVNGDINLTGEIRKNGVIWNPSGGGGSYTLPPATATNLGGIKVGANLTITGDGVLSAQAASGGATGLAVTGATTAGAVTAPTASGPLSVAIGHNARATHYLGNTILIGANTTNNKENSVQIGVGSQVTDGSETVVGYQTYTRYGGQAFGARARAVGRYATVFGQDSRSENGTLNTQGGVVFGSSSTVSAVDGVVVGGQSTASAQGAVVLGSNLVNTEANTVMVGNPSGTVKRVKGVADGTQPTDAVNKRQLDAAVAGGGSGGGGGTFNPATTVETVNTPADYSHSVVFYDIFPAETASQPFVRFTVQDATGWRSPGDEINLFLEYYEIQTREGNMPSGYPYDIMVRVVLDANLRATGDVPLSWFIERGIPVTGDLASFEMLVYDDNGNGEFTLKTELLSFDAAEMVNAPQVNGWFKPAKNIAAGTDAMDAVNMAQFLSGISNAQMNPNLSNLSNLYGFGRDGTYVKNGYYFWTVVTGNYTFYHAGSFLMPNAGTILNLSSWGPQPIMWEFYFVQGGTVKLANTTTPMRFAGRVKTAAGARRNIVPTDGLWEITVPANTQFRILRQIGGTSAVFYILDEPDTTL